MSRRVDQTTRLSFFEESIEEEKIGRERNNFEPGVKIEKKEEWMEWLAKNRIFCTAQSFLRVIKTRMDEYFFFTFPKNIDLDTCL